MPRIKRIPHITEDRKTNNLAIAAAPPAMSMFPNTAAAKATTRKMQAHRSIDFHLPRDGFETAVRTARLSLPIKARMVVGILAVQRRTANFTPKYDSFL